MPISDLNDPLDFARATMGTAGQVLQAFGRSPDEWDILEASYIGPDGDETVFHVFESKQVYQAAVPQVTDEGGRRKVKYMYPYRDGQTTEDLGRKPETIDLDVVLFGKNYRTILNQFLVELNKPLPGILIHPVRGRIQCGMEDYRLVHKHDARNAVNIQLTMIEHNFSIVSFETLSEDKSFNSAISRALEAFENIEAAIVQVSAAISFVQSQKNIIIGALEEFKGNYANTLSKVNSTFNTSGSLDIPTLLPVNEGGLLDSDGNQVTDTFPLVASPSDPFASTPIDDLTSTALLQTLATEEAVNEVNARRQEISDIIELMSVDEGAVELHGEITDLLNDAKLLQDALERGVASSKSLVVDYTTPRLMTIREVAFASGVSLNEVQTIEILNPELLSVNYIPKQTTLKVPSS